MSFLSTVVSVFRKELIDAVRDRRTMLVVLISGVLMGPLILVAISGLVASMEARAEKRVIYVTGIEHAPSLKNFIQRQTWSIKEPPADYEEQLRASKFSDPVVVVPANFERDLIAGEKPTLEIVNDSANTASAAGARGTQRMLESYKRERVGLSLTLRGIAPVVIDPVAIEDRDLASTQTRALRITGMLPFFVMMAVLYGALNAALDSTAGERERGSLEPLVMTPAHSMALVLGKWGAVASVAMVVALLTCLSFLPAQMLLRSDVLQAMFQFGWRETVLFLVVLVPYAAAISAVLMAVAIRCKSFKEAQANSSVVLLGVSLLPLFSLLNQEGEAPWHLWVPALAQNTLMVRVLKGEDFTLPQVIIPLLVCVVLTVAANAFVAQAMRRAAVK